MSQTETRYSEIRAQDGNRLTGTVLRYNDVAVVAGQPERFAPGAFGDTSAFDVILNVQHQRTRPIARTGSGLTLRDGPESLTMAAELPQTRDAADTLELVRSGVLRGLSVEFRAIRESFVGGVRVIHEAVLTGLGVVDRPAYPASVVEARAEIRQDGDTLVGSFPYMTPITTSDRGRVRKSQWTPDSWKFALEDLNREILIQLGDAGRNQVIASRRAGSVKFETDEKRLKFVARLEADTSYLEDFSRQLNSGQIEYTLRPFQSIPPVERVAKPYVDLPEKGNPGVFIRTFGDTILNSMNITPRGGAGSVQIRQFEPWL